MIVRHRFLTGILATTILLSSGGAGAQTARTSSAPSEQESSAAELTAASCNVALRDRLTQQQRVLRQIWFGRKNARNLPVNATRYDTQGTPWIKVSRDTWRSAAEETVRSDAGIDEETEWEGMNEPLDGVYHERSRGARNDKDADVMVSSSAPLRTSSAEPRIGIFEQKQMLTSELIPQLTQSFRAFQCRLAMVCEGMRQSFALAEPEEDGYLRIATSGCEELLMEPLQECRFGNADPAAQADHRDLIAGVDETIIHTECEPLAEQLIDREAAFLRIAVAYDAAQRSALQLSGVMDGLLQGLRGDILAPIREILPLLSQLSRIPCFAAQCNE